MKTKAPHDSRRSLNVHKAVHGVYVTVVLIFLSFHFSCSNHEAENRNDKKVTNNAVVSPIAILGRGPFVVNLDTCPAPHVVTLSTSTTSQFIKQSNGDLLKLQPPEIKPADFLSRMSSHTSDQGLPIDMTVCGKVDKKGNLWIGTIGAGVSRYDGKTFVNFTIAQGLGNDAVWSIAEDKNENIWIGTYGGGVSRYDGQSFVNFNTSHGLVNNFVLSILEDSKGNLWFGTRNGLSRYDGKSFFNYKLQQTTDNIVWDIREDKKGNLWFGTNGGVFYYDGKSFTNLSKKDGLINNTVRGIVEDKKGKLWFATEGGVSCYDKGVFINYTTLEGLSHNDVRCVQEDKNGNLWFGMFGGGMSRFDGKKFTNYTTKQGLINDKVTGFAEDKSGNIWALTFGGLSCYEGDAFINYTTQQGMSNNFVYGIMEDTKGNLWFNTNSSGILCYDGKRFISYTVSQGFPNSPSACSVEDRTGKIWFGTYIHGISCFDGKSVTNYTKKQGLISNSISSCILDRSGNLWFGSLNGGVSCYDGKSFINYTAAQGLNGVVTSMLEDHSRRLWIGTEGNGIYCYDGNFFTNYSTGQGLSNNNVRNVVEDNAGNIWIATDVGIARYDGKSFLNYTTKDGLPDKNATQLSITREQHLAIGTNKGIAIMTSFIKTNKDQRVTETLPAQNDLTNAMLKTYAPVFEIFNSATGCPVKDVNTGQGTIYKDHKGILWIATGSDKTALVRFDYAALHKTNLIPSVYIQHVKVNDETICWSDLSKMDTSPNCTVKADDSSNVPLNITEEVTAFGVPLSDEERDTLHQKFGDIKFDSITRFYSIPENLVLPYKNNNITFDFAAIEPAKPYLVNYQYQLKGYDDDWTPVSNKTTATFGNIYEGTYTFKLKAQGPSGLWSEPVVYTFKVRPPWWRTWWMYSIYGVLVIGFVIIIVRWYNKRLLARAKILAQEIKKATQEIVEQKKIVEEKNKIVEERNKSITDSINYALRIQKAFLPKKEQFYSNLPKSFILFKPKDIVSGDFYFFHKMFPVKETMNKGLFFIAAVDCTGHGVPGAFLSMVGSERLTDAVQQSDQASEILSLLNKGVKNSLHQTGEDESTRDGMDIAICSLDMEQRIVKYAGANRPLWLIRKGQNEVEEIKSTKVAVGGLTEDDQHFESHELQLQEGDTFYIFSDGYADIFSGESGKKLTTKKFKQLLLDIQNKTMQEQEHYLDSFIEDWKAGTEQVDDILVIGIRI